MSDQGKFNADLGINMHFNIDGAGLTELSKTIKEIAKGKDLQRYWTDVETATDNASKALNRYSRNIDSRNLAENLIKQINALKALTKNENLSELFPNTKLNIDELLQSAKKIVPKINSEFSTSNFSQAFNTFDLLKEKALDLKDVFFILSDYSHVISENSRLNIENNEFSNIIGDNDISDIKTKISEIKRLRDEAENIFESFLKVNNIERTDFWGDERFSEYFDEIRDGSLTATEAITKFKTEFSYLLEENFKSNGDSFGLDQLQEFSNKLDNIFYEVEESSKRINDIISNGVLTKSVQNLSTDSSLTDSQRSLFGNLLQDEESLNQITNLFQKLVEESNKAKNIELFNDEHLQQILLIFEKIESSLSSLRKIISDVGDGEEFSPLLKTINDVQKSIKELSTTVSGIKLNVGIDLGSETSERSNQKISQIVNRQLEAYRKLFSAMKSTGKTNKEMLQFFEPDEASVTELVGIYRSVIERAEKQFKVGHSNIYKKYLGSTYDELKKEITNANRQLSRAETKDLDGNIIDNLFGGSQDLSGVISQLELIVSKLEEISLTASNFKDIFKDGFNVTASVEEIEKLTNRVKELEEELSKVKTSTVAPVESNISSDIKDAFQGDTKNTEDSSAAIKEESKALEQVSDSAKEASAAKENFAKANKKVKESAESSSDAVKEEVENLKKFSDSELSGMEKDLAKFSARSDGFRIKPDNGHSFDTWKNQISDLNNNIEQYQKLVEKARANGGIVDKEDETQITNLKNEIEGLISTMSKFPQSKRGWDDGSARKLAEKINKALEDNPRLAKSAQDSLKAYYNELASGKPTRPLNEIQNVYLEIIQQQRELGNTGKNWLDIFKDKKIYSFLGQAASMFSFYDLVNVTKQGINTVKEFDDGLTKISYTMDMTKSKLNDLGNSVLNMASDMKSSVDDAMSVAQIYANMQTTAEEIQKLSEPTLILTNLSGFDSSTIADDIQAVNQQFDILAEDSMHIADVYDYISRNIAVDYSKGLNSIAEGLQVAGSTANQAGLSFEQTSAIIAKAVEKTRLEGSQVGNGLKTILTRTSKVGKLSDEVDNDTLSQASESLKKIGIEVYNLDGSYREFDVIMTELAGKWDDLTDAERSNISFSLAATRQTNLLSAILSNFSDSMKLAEEATNAEGSALENQQKYMDSFSGHLQSLETEAKIAWINILNSEDLENGVDLLTGLVKVVGQLVDTFGVLPILMGGAGSLGITQFVKSFD